MPPLCQWSPTPPSSLDGGNVGFSAAAVMERFLIQQAAASSLEHMADQSARNKLYRRIAEEDQVAQIRPSKEMHEGQQDLEEVHDALHLQYAELITAHSKFLNRNRGKNEKQHLVSQSKQMRDKVVSLDARARDNRLNAEECQKARFVSAWISCLKKWEETIKEQADIQAEWQMGIEKWKRG